MITHVELLSLMTYDPGTGIFRWREYRYPRRPDLVVGFMSDTGYLRCKIGPQTFPLHRLAWFYVHKRWPSGQIDHINLDKTDNRLSNLRDATHAQNKTHTEVYRNNRLGVRGVRKKNRGLRYEARITHEGRVIHLGHYLTIEEAAAARKAAERLLHGEFAGP